MSDLDVTNVLVVDDLPDKLLVYRTILEELGQNLLTARSGEEALGQVLRNDFAVILLDVNMPGMDGFETAALIRSRKRSAHTPIIFLTAFADEVRAAEGYAHGAVDYIQTPVVPEVLRAKVRVFVDLYRMTQQVRRQAEERVALAEERARRELAEAESKRADYLADVSRALADSLDPETTARTLARLVVPYLADLAGVTLPGEQGQPWRTELAWTSPVKAEVQSLRIAGRDGPHDTLRSAVERALLRGHSAHLDQLDIPYPIPDESAVPARIRSALVLPLRARGRILGVLTLTVGPSGRAYGSAELALADDLASRAAIALDNARLYNDMERADRQKNEFLSMLAHELRNPLAPIRNSAEVIRLTAPDQPRLQKAREVIDRQLTHLVRLVDDLLDVSRITGGKIRLQFGPVELNAVVIAALEACSPAIERAGHRLTVELPERPVFVTGDSARLTQILTNLLNNAAKYPDAGGRILTALRTEGDATEIVVRDSGIGIPQDMLAAVFELFTQMDRSLDRSQGGLGVGLTLVKRLVELHGGTVSAHSDGPGTGAEFRVRLPISNPPAREPGAEPAATLVPVGALRVLVVDDNTDAAESLAEVLRQGGHDVRLAATGSAALALADEFRPNVILLDIGLPGMNGFEVARRLRARPSGRSASIAALTGYGREDDRRNAHEAGFDHYLVKPVDTESLRRLLATVPRPSNGQPAPVRGEVRTVNPAESVGEPGLDAARAGSGGEAAPRGV
jgi:signal transduction histidine kinase/DNA-binding response OmpR family regulator